MKLSVIVPVYNTEQYLGRCLNSLVNQTLQDMEILVVDDGSTDGSLAIAKEFEQSYPDKLKVFTKENGGQSTARNLAMEHAAGEYLGFADSDDWVDADMYEKLYEAAICQNADIAVCDIEEHYPSHVVRHSASEHQNWAKGAPSVWDKIYKRQTVGSDRFLPGLWYEDLEFTARQFMKTGKVAVIHTTAYHCFYRPGSTMRNNNSIKNLDIITIMESLERFTEEAGIRAQNKENFEILYIDHILIEAINRVQRQTSPEKGRVLRQLRQTVKCRCPQIYGSAAFRNQPLNRRIVARLNGLGLSICSKWLVDLKGLLKK